ncbi:hypothetical protein H2203_003273 [Taxawa tesnikishii (nom. ined.)]|nr:hypothetical protein H2203_003273 [Dothideales sp. JES 119]
MLAPPPGGDSLFDGGALAKKVYDRREFTFDSKIVARNLSLVRAGEEEDRRKPSVRSNTVRYLLANFRYQAEGVKEDILKHANVVKALFDHIKDDSLDILQETLKVLETHVLRDDGITRSSKSHLLSERSLISIVGIIRTTSHANADSEVLEREGKRRSAALAFLKLIGSTPSLGVLRPSGWYPPGAERATDEEAEADEGDDELGLDLLPSSSQRFRGHIPVRNPILSGFIQNLRPHGSPEERELILAIFAAAPELVADYSLKKGDRFPFDPKLTNTWIGYASFVFSTVEQDIPPEFGAQGGTAIKPPPVSVVLENLLPLPLTQKALTRCLNQTSDLVTFFAVRILVLAVQKLQNILNFFNTNAGERAAALWKNAADQLVSEFSQRCPPIKDVIATSRKIPEENLVQREAIARLLRLYHLVLPQQALEEKFDVSASLVTALARAERTAGQEKKGLEMLELQHLLVIAQASAGMRWWHKQGALQYSPFVTLLRLCSASRDDTAIYTEFRKLLKSVVHEYGILCEGLKYESLDGLIASLAPSEFWTTENATYTFLDECLGRLVRKSVKYLDDLDQLRGNDNGKEVSLLVMACLEQVDFTTRLPEADRDDVVDWLFRFLKMLQLCGEACCDADLGMDGILYEHTNRDGPGCVTMDRIAGVFDKVVAAAQRTAPSESATVRLLHEGNVTQPSVVFRDPSTEKQDHPELYRWQQKDVEEAIDNGDVDGLVLCLCSAYEDVRLQALANVRKLIISIQVSSDMLSTRLQSG